MKHAKPIQLLLCAAILLPLAVSCQNPEDTADPVGTGAENPTVTQTEAAETESVALLDALPSADFGGETFTILTNNRTDDYRSVEIMADAMDGTLITDAVYLRNAAVENRYGIDIVAQPMDGEAQALKNSVLADDGAYDLALIGMTDAGALAQEGILADLNALPHLTLDGDWWDQNAAKELSLAGRLYMMLGDMNINDKDMTWCLFFDKKLAADYDLPDLYALAAEKKWTFDVFSSLIRNITSDVNGDGIFDDKDNWGHVTVYARSTIAYLYSMGYAFIEKNSADLPVLQMDQPQIYDAYDRVVELFHSDNLCHDVETMPFDGYPHQWRKCEAMFGAQQILFYAEAMQNAERFRTFENDFGILPLPSLEEGEYGRHMVWRESYVTVAPTTALVSDEQAEKVGLILEALQRESHTTVLGAYYDKALKSKFSRDESSSDMIDIIFDTRYFDIATYYGWGGLSARVMTLGKAGKTGLASSLETIREKTENDLQLTADMLNEQ